MNDESRRPSDVLFECVGHHALLAVREHYARRPSLWQRGEHGRDRCLTDYQHHFRVLSALEPERWRAHRVFMEQVWTGRRLDPDWLDEAWAIMEHVLRSDVPWAIWAQAVDVLRMAQRPPEAGPEAPESAANHVPKAGPMPARASEPSGERRPARRVRNESSPG